MIAPRKDPSVRFAAKFSLRPALWRVKDFSLILTAVFFIGYYILILLIFRDYGIIWDEYPQSVYGNYILRYYSSLFQDQAANKYMNMHLYGGFFDLLCALANKISPWPVYETRHLINALFALLGVFYSYRLASLLIPSRYFALLAAILLFFTPRYFGHSFFNPKDIPFAALYTVSLYYLGASIAYWQQEIPKKLIAQIALSFGCCMGIRVGGLLLACYFLLFFSLYQLWLLLTKATGFKTALRHLAKNCLLPIFLAYLVMIVFWPWAQQNPIYHPWKALGELSHFHINGRQLFEGKSIHGTMLPWYYIYKWLLLTTPVIILIGLLFFMPRCLASWSDKMKASRPGEKWLLALLVFAWIFPLVYVVYQGSNLYNGVRHFLFVLPLIAICAAIGFAAFYDSIVTKIGNAGGKRIFTVIFVAVVVLPLGEIAAWYVRSHPNQYVYFNRLIGGLPAAYGRYELDYWGSSYRQAAEWLNGYALTYKRRYHIKRKLYVRVYGHPLSVWYYLDKNHFQCDFWQLSIDPMGGEQIRDNRSWDFFIIARVLDKHSPHLYSNGQIHGIEIKTIKLDKVPLVSIYQKVRVRYE